MQKKRAKEDTRYTFTVDEKKEMLKRTNGKCAKCGKELILGTKDCTVEHIIPISKGGKNEPSNLICMCKSCNLLKGNDIVQPSWYKYLNEDELPSVERLFIRYLKEYCHISDRNLLPIDQYSMKIHFNAKTGDIYCDSSGRIIDVEKEIIWKKAHLRDDLDKIVEAYKRFNKKNEIECPDLKTRVSYLIREHCLYYVEDSHGEIKAVVPFSLAEMELGVNVKKFIYGSAKANKQMPCVLFVHPINCTSKRVYSRAMIYFFQYIVASLMTTLDTEVMRSIGYSIRTNNLEQEIRLCVAKADISVEGNSIVWDGFTCLDEKDVGIALKPKEIDSYIKKTNAKIKELGLSPKDADIIIQKG